MAESFLALCDGGAQESKLVACVFIARFFMQVDAIYRGMTKR